MDHMQYKQSSEFSETHREESGISEFIRPYKNAYVAARISTKHNYTELRTNPDHPYLMRQGGQTPNSYNEEETNKKLNDEHLKELTSAQSCSTNYDTQENSGSLITDNYWAILSEESIEEDLEPHERLRESTSQSLEGNCNFNMIQPLKSRKHGIRGNSSSCFSMDPWAILDHPHTMRQGRTDTDDSKDCASKSEAELCKDTENSETQLIENSKMQFNTRKLPSAKGHIVHSWDILLDMGAQGLEITLPQLLEGTCKSQTISSLSFGSQGGKSMELDIITNLGESHYVACGKGVIVARRCMKQRYVELGFTKVVSNGRAIYINKLVTVGPSEPALTARVMEHAQKRKRQRKTSKQRRISKANKQMTAMGITVGGLRADSGGTEEGAGAEERDETEITEEQKLGKLITLYKWRLAQFNMADARRGGGAKWEGLSQLMEEHKLHGIALQELRITDQTTFMANKHMYKGLTLLMHPCIEGDLGGAAGGTGFLVRTELLEQELFLDFGSINTVGFYGAEVISTLKIRTARHYCTWVSMYVRQRGTSFEKGYELRKYEPLKHIKNKIVMGDLNGSVVYSQPIKTCIRHGLGGSVVAVRNKMHKYGQYLSELWKAQNMEDISAKGKYAWAETRTDPNSTSNKLDCIVVSSNVVKDLKAKVTLIKTASMYRRDLDANWAEGDEPQNWELSDHKLVIMELKSGCQLKIRKFVCSESYKLAPFLSSANKQLQFTKETNRLGAELRGMLDMEIDDINDKTVEGLKTVSKAEVGISINKRVAETRVHTDVKEVVISLRASRVCDAEVSKLQALGDALAIQRAKQDLKTARAAYYRAVSKQKQKVHDQRRRRLEHMDSAGKSKMLHSMINKAKEGGEVRGGVASEATMNFEGRKAHAVGEGQIKKLLAAYTSYVSMDSTDKASSREMDAKLKRNMTSFNLTDDIQDVFDEKARAEVDKRCELIREEYLRGETPIIEKSLEANFTRKELKAAMKKLKTKYWKSTGLDGIRSWMIDKAGEGFLGFLLEFYNKCWEKGEIPSSWYETLISYIYKNKGKLQELTSYRPIALTSMLANIFKTMWLHRIVPIVDKHLSHCQGGFRVGSGVKEQLWALLEFMEEGDNDETERIFCTTDVHKAFDQVYRNGTIYLLYGMGVRGKMLHMLDQWISRNYAVQKWRGHTGDRVELTANGLRQGCTLSPILYLVVINVLVSKEPNVSMPEWDKGYRAYAYSSGVQNLEHVNLGEWMVYLFCDDTAFVAENPVMMDLLLGCYKNFTIRWRIRVNPGKCKIMYSERTLAADVRTHRFGDIEIAHVQSLKYLGYWIGRAGRAENDKHIIAQATQLRFKIRAVLPILGEMLTLVLLESHETPRVLFGAELGKLTVATLNQMHAWNLSEALGVGRYEASQGYTRREVAAAVIWADYEGYTWSQLRGRNAKVLYRSVRRMGPDTAPAKRLQKVGNSNVLVDCFMKALMGRLPENTAGNKGGGRQLAVRKALQWNSGRETQKIKWKEAESKRMGYENLQWKRKLISNTVTKARECLLMDCEEEVKKFGTSSTVFMTTSEGKRGLERTISHTSTKVSTSTKVAARKIRGGRIRGMKVLAYMNTVRWGNMSTADREEATQCPCECGIQNVEHVISDCEYTAGYLEEMINTVDCALSSEREAAQGRWMLARGVREKVAAIVGMETRGVSPEALGEVAASLKLLVRQVEKTVRTVNKVGESWPMDSLAVWAPDGDGPQVELQIDMVSSDDQQMVAA